MMMASDQVNNTCKCLVCLGIKKTINDIYSVLKIYGWILDSYIIDFYHGKLWSKLPNSWTKILDDISPEEFGSWIINDFKIKNHVLPLSLLSLGKLLKLLTINRDEKTNTAISCSNNKKIINNKLNCNDYEKYIIDNNNKILKLKNLFNKNVKEKKRYEIENFSKYCSYISYVSNCNAIIDIGAGIGHLSRKLSYKYNKKMICIEKEKSLSDSAQKYDDNFINILKKSFKKICGQRPYHYCTKIVDESYEGSELSDKFNDILIKNFLFNEDEYTNEFGLIGLHPCGDLAVRLLKFFIKQNNAKFICVVGCCYMKLTTGKNEAKIGYPLSKFVRDKSDNSLSYEALEVACHAVENYCDKLKNSLEDIYVRKGDGIKHGYIGSVKVKNQMSFNEYCKLATMPLEKERQLTEDEIDNKIVNKNINEWKKVVIFEGLRMMLAPLVETLVLFDRFLFLSEHNIAPQLKAIFDPRISSRNFVITAIKNTKI
ncbi:hypothetical protein HCN44_008547 [Aphidius gifuensis]|uniref:Methyltransferase domain-containing protein n=1 Tax=Aphidius gifuensis TaxID=684658 RepID=A0A834XNW7_APHGI|nr:hypothetical protein HCN44_008547 [Aphidius gifuensis]